MEVKRKCGGGPPGAELGTLTSVRRWSAEHTLLLPGDLKICSYSVVVFSEQSGRTTSNRYFL